MAIPQAAGLIATQALTAGVTGALGIAQAAAGTRAAKRARELNTEQLEGFKLNGRSWRVRESAIEAFISQQEAGEHEPPTVKGDGPTDLGAWRKDTKGAA